MKRLEGTAGCNLLLFHQIPHFLSIRNLLYYLQTANRAWSKSCGEDSCLPVGLRISAVAYKSLVADELEVVHHILVCFATVSVEVSCRQ